MTEKTQIIKDGLKSFSKINLCLWVKEKRSDGYHEIETIFYENKDLYDDIEVEFLPGQQLLIEVSFLQKSLNDLIPVSENLAYKAALLYLNKTAIAGHCKIKINKNIPHKAGLGGGSSNAACVLKALNQIFNNQLSLKDLLDLAFKLGSDVPFFILGGTCLGKGRGEKLEQIVNDLNLKIKIVKPGNISVSTKWAYEQIDSREFIADHRSDIDNLLIAIKNKDHNLFFKSIFNDFEMVVYSFYPELISCRKKLLDEGYRSVLLCGSGSALVGIK